MGDDGSSRARNLALVTWEGRSSCCTKGFCTYIQILRRVNHSNWVDRGSIPCPILDGPIIGKVGAIEEGRGYRFSTVILRTSNTRRTISVVIVSLGADVSEVVEAVIEEVSRNVARSYIA